MFLFTKALSNASGKIIATFFMALLLMLVGVLFFPTVFNAVNDFANWIANWNMVRNPDFGEQGVAVTRVFINESTIFGVVMTLIARIIVELIWLGIGGLWRMVNPPEEPMIQPGRPQQNYYGEN